MKTILRHGTVTSFTFASKIANATKDNSKALIFTKIQELYYSAEALPIDVGSKKVDYAIYISVDGVIREAGILNDVPAGYKIYERSFQAITTEVLAGMSSLVLY